MSGNPDEAPSIDEQEDEPQIGMDEEDLEETGIGDEAVDRLEQAYEVIEAFHGRSISAEQQATDRIRELEIQAERGAYGTALQIVAVAIESEDGSELENFVQDPELAAEFQEMSRRFRGVGTGEE